MGRHNVDKKRITKDLKKSNCCYWPYVTSYLWQQLTNSFYFSGPPRNRYCKYSFTQSKFSLKTEKQLNNLPSFSCLRLCSFSLSSIHYHVWKPTQLIYTTWIVYEIPSQKAIKKLSLFWKWQVTNVGSTLNIFIVLLKNFVRTNLFLHALLLRQPKNWV